MYVAKKAGQFLIICVCFLYSGNVSLATDTYPPLTANQEYSLVAPYDTIATGSGNQSDGAGASGRWYTTITNKYRIRQDGDITHASIYIASGATVDTFTIQVWRKDGSTYDLVGESDNLADQITAGTTNFLTLDTPITDVLEGDYYGFHIDSPGTVTSLVSKSLTSSTIRYSDSAPTSTNFAWDSQTSVATSAIPLEVYMTPAPQIVLIGDSIIAGHPAHYSFVEATSTTSLSSTIPYFLKTIGGYTYQNMGIGGQRTSQILARFSSDVIALKPRVVVLEGGVNDIANGTVTQSQFLANMEDMLDAIEADEYITHVFVLKILPWSNGTNVQMQTRDDWNDALATLVAGYSKAQIVDASSYVGEFRSGGDSGNLWDIQAIYDVDGVHFNTAGHEQIAQAILDTFDVTVPTLTSVSSSVSNGTYAVGEVIDIDVTFSESVTSTGNITVTLETGVTDRTCTFTITDSTTGTCNYTVQEGDTSNDLDIVSVSGTVTDAYSNAVVDFIPETSLATNKDIVVEGVSPTISVISPLDDATGVSSTANAVITFDSTVIIGTGNISIYKSSDDSLVEAIDVTGGLVSGSGTSTITVNPNTTLDSLTSYYIQIDATAFDDASGNGFAGMNDETTWVFTTIQNSQEESVERSVVGTYIMKYKNNAIIQKPLKISCSVYGAPVTIKKGAVSSHAKNVQKAINQLMPNNPLVEDGIIGPKSFQGIINAQVILKTTPDGIWGPMTQKSYLDWILNVCQ